MALDFQKINEAAENYRADMAAFLRAMISHPSESCEEKEVVACIKAEMEKLNFDKVEVDGLGNVIGWMGDGEKIIAIDSHIDTVGIGNIDNWKFDPGLPALPDTYYRPWPHSHLLPISSGFR